MGSSLWVSASVSPISQLWNLRYLSHLESKSPSLKVEMEHNLTTQHLFYDYGKWDEAESDFVFHSPGNSISNACKLSFPGQGSGNLVRSSWKHSSGHHASLISWILCKSNITSLLRLCGNQIYPRSKISRSKTPEENSQCIPHKL